MMKSLPVNFTFAQFRKATPFDETRIWGFLLDRHSEKISLDDATSR